MHSLTRGRIGRVVGAGAHGHAHTRCLIASGSTRGGARSLREDDAGDVCARGQCGSDRGAGSEEQAALHDVLLQGVDLTAGKTRGRATTNFYLENEENHNQSENIASRA